nr:immunoglobulin heavy chain junction region [Macaca mulatta]MOX58922.1 immunoglobulin heavy chain junction region [Macaca mulatta]MOX59104.1 immunoglobulin heavy chain junction region [Macaca mulatta]MOX59309.1 immunoglobulin heavy chain junction region [Macaca mulatta]MOX59315.1 immunoglobulin heavy chain junction region [Macaca mulatta]
CTGGAYANLDYW